MMVLGKESEMGWVMLEGGGKCSPPLMMRVVLSQCGRNVRAASIGEPKPETTGLPIENIVKSMVSRNRKRQVFP